MATYSETLSEKVRQYKEHNRKSLSITNVDLLEEVIKTLEWIEDQPPNANATEIALKLGSISMRLLHFFTEVLDGPIGELLK